MASAAKKLSTPIEGLQIKAGDLAAAMKNAASIIQSAQTIPVLANVLLVADGQSLQITTSDLDTEYRQDIPLDTECTLATTIDARKFAAIVGSVDAQAVITMTVEDGRATIKSGRSRWQLPIIRVDDFPCLKFSDTTPQAEIIGVELAEAFARVSWAMYVGTARPYLAGVFVHPVSGKMTLAATDGAGLAISATGVSLEQSSASAMVSDKYISTLAGLVAGYDGMVLLAWDDRKIRASFAGVVLTGSLIDGSFPDYTEVVPAPCEAPIVFDPAALLGALKRVQIVSDKTTQGIIVDRGDGLVALKVANAASASNEDIPAECAAGFSTGINGRILGAAVSAIGGDSIEMHQAESRDPILLRRVVDDGMFAVIMPMRI